MAYSAFQSNAFQRNAFQILGSSRRTGGHFLPVYLSKRHKKQPLGNLIRIYSESKERFNDSDELIAAIEPYIEEIEAEKDSPQAPPPPTINIEALMQNEAAARGFIDSIEKIEKRLAMLAIQNGEDEDLLLIASLIN